MVAGISAMTSRWRPDRVQDRLRSRLAGAPGSVVADLAGSASELRAPLSPGCHTCLLRPCLGVSCTLVILIISIYNRVSLILSPLADRWYV